MCKDLQIQGCIKGVIREWLDVYSDHIILQSYGLSCVYYYVVSHDKGEDVRIKD